MSRTERVRPTGAAAVVGAMIGIAALAGCGAGQVAQTAEQVATAGGANAGAGRVVVRDARIEFADGVEGGNVYVRGDNAPLRMSIVNTGTDADRLVSATSPAATSVRVTGDAEVPAGQVLVVEGEPPAPAPTRTGVPTAGSRGGAASTPAPSGSAGGPDETQIVLTGLREDVRAGLTYPVVLTFERAGDIRLDVPVANPSVPRAGEAVQ